MACTTSSSGLRTSTAPSASGAGCSTASATGSATTGATAQAWELGALYIVLECGPDVADGGHERKRPGLNHLAFHAGSRDEVEALVADCAAHGWSLMFADRHPFAGGPDHYAAYLENGEGFEVELVAR